MHGFISGLYLFMGLSVPLIYISVFVPVPYCLDDCSFVVWSEVRQVDFSNSILLSQDCFGYWRFFVFPTNCEIICSGITAFFTSPTKVPRQPWVGMAWAHIHPGTNPCLQKDKLSICRPRNRRRFTGREEKDYKKKLVINWSMTQVTYFSLEMSCWFLVSLLSQKFSFQRLPHGAVDRNPPANAKHGFVFWFKQREASTCHGATMLACHNCWAYVLWLLRPQCLEPVLHAARETMVVRSPCITTNSGPCSLQLEKALSQQWRLSAAKK